MTPARSVAARCAPSGWSVSDHTRGVERAGELTHKPLDPVAHFDAVRCVQYELGLVRLDSGLRAGEGTVDAQDLHGNDAI